MKYEQKEIRLLFNTKSLKTKIAPHLKPDQYNKKPERGATLVHFDI
jgi:hypothetical protein